MFRTRDLHLCIYFTFFFFFSLWSCYTVSQQMHCYDIYVNEDRGAEAGDDASMMGPVIAVMCAVGSSERGSKPQKKKNTFIIMTNARFPDSTWVFTTFLKSRKILDRTTFVPLCRPYKRPIAIYSLR